MSIVIDGTNALTDILGDSDTEYNLTLNNSAVVRITEPLTGLVIEPQGSVDFTLVGDLAYQQLQSNIDQINQLKGFTALSFVVAVENNGMKQGSLQVDLIFWYTPKLPNFAFATIATSNKFEWYAMIRKHTSVVVQIPIDLGD